MHSIQELEELLPTGCSLFFIGIGGVSMSALAMIAKEKGYHVSGSDRAVSANTHMLTEAGIPVFPCHNAANIKDSDAVIYNAAIGEDNPEYAAAKSSGIPLIPSWYWRCRDARQNHNIRHALSSLSICRTRSSHSDRCADSGARS